LKKTLVILGLIGLCVFTLMKFGIESGSINTNDSLQPKQVIENYFKFSNDKNREGMLTTLTEWQHQPNVVFGLEDLKFIKLVSIGN